MADCKSELPLAIKITPASVNDGIIAIPLIKKFKESYGETFDVKHCIMDSGYDIQGNYDYIINEFHSQPIIAYNKRTSIERCNSRLKDYLSADNIRSSGIKKAKTFALLNCITLIAGTIAVNKEKSLPKVA